MHVILLLQQKLTMTHFFSSKKAAIMLQMKKMLQAANALSCHISQNRHFQVCLSHTCYHPQTFAVISCKHTERLSYSSKHLEVNKQRGQTSCEICSRSEIRVIEK